MPKVSTLRQPVRDSQAYDLNCGNLAAFRALAAGNIRRATALKKENGRMGMSSARCVTVTVSGAGVIPGSTI
jgi:hypothetical protein